MGVQNFKASDTVEQKVQAVGEPVFAVTEAALDEFLQNGFNAAPFLLMLYDEGRMPFSKRIAREAFVDFIVQALANFPFTGTFDSYLFVLKAIFGDSAEIRFYVDTEGTLAIDVEAAANSEFNFIGREFVDGAYTYFNMTDSDGNQLIFRGAAGVTSEYELNLLFAEIMPVGISPTITLGFFEISEFIDDDSDFIVDDDGNGIIFVEGGA